MQEAFRKDLTHLTWDEVYARQVKRASLVGEWMDTLHLKSGDRLLEIGAGPGYVSLVLADRVGPAGTIYAVDRSADALNYLQRLQKERGVSNIERLVADAATLELAGVHVHWRWSQWFCIMPTTRPASFATSLVCFVQELRRSCRVSPGRPLRRGTAARASHLARTSWRLVRSWGLLMVSERRQSAEHYMTFGATEPTAPKIPLGGLPMRN